MPSLRDHFVEYSENTSLHGVRYIGERKRPIAERICWILIIVVSILACGELIWEAWSKWQRTPVIVTLSDVPTSIREIPFPAVTICPQNKIIQSKFNFTFAYIQTVENGSLTKEEKDKLIDLTLLCKYELDLNSGRKFLNRSVLDFFEEVGPKFNETMIKCNTRWLLEESCETIFTPLLTEDGFCYTFNMLDTKDFYTDSIADYFLKDSKKENANSTWNLKDGYKKGGKSVFIYPYRATGAGSNAGLEIILASKPADMDYYCREPLQGFEVVLHHPAEVPRVAHQNYRIPLNQDVQLAVRPEMIKTTNRLRMYSSKKRGCYFPDERHLRFYRTYTYENCQVECLTNFTLQICDCVSLFMARDNKTAICGPQSRECVETAQDVFDNFEVYDESVEDLEIEHPKYICKCLPPCIDLQFNAELSQGNYDWKMSYKFDQNLLDGYELSRVVIYMKQPQFITSRRSEMYGRMDFLANCGGILGLFMGFSLISFVELIYFFTVRIVCNRRHREGSEIKTN